MPWTGRTPRAQAAAARAKAIYMKKAKAANIIKRAVSRFGRTKYQRWKYTIPARKPYFQPYSKFYLASLRRRSYRRYRRR